MKTKNVYIAIKVSLVVGTILNTINSCDTILNGKWSIVLIGKIMLTYLTPFCVSLYSSSKAIKN
ncbi:MAG: nitrate/nitrite transporter NrtS [Bacteroidota bacterium]|nr:nitrate/nitrite transporter NrtS [Bacteroidota bacterium]